MTRDPLKQIQVEMFPDQRLELISNLASLMARDHADWDVSQLAAELCRATVGVGDYAIPQLKSTSSTKRRPR
jgi:hypothetical protein